MPKPEILPIGDEDLDEFSEFLQQQFGGSTPAKWRAVFQHNWCEEKPNNGFMLRDDSRLVGVIGAIYASREIRGKQERFCNITCWAVLPEYRVHSMRLAVALTSQAGYHFTDFTPTNTVTKSLQFLKFEPLDARQILVPNLPRLGYPFGSARIIDEPTRMLSVLPKDRVRVMRDHSQLPWIRQVVIVNANEPVHIVYKPVKFKDKPCAFVLAASDRGGFTRYFPLFRHYLLFKCGILCTRLERRYLNKLPLFGFNLKRFPRKLFYSPTLKEADIDSLYSEVASVDLPGYLI